MEKNEYLANPIGIEKYLLSRLHKNGKHIIMDIGSCDGLDAIRYSGLFPNSKIYAFEPLKENFELIQSNLREFKTKNIEAFNYALSNNTEIAKFYKSSGKPPEIDSENWDYGNKSSSLLPPENVHTIFPWLTFSSPIDIETITLKQFINDKNLSHIDFIHIDVQGAEKMVLEGAFEFITRIKIIWMEVVDIPHYQGQPTRHDMENFMLKNNFTLIKDLEGDQLWVNLNYFPLKKMTNYLYRLSHSLRIYPSKKKINPAKFSKESFSQCGEDLIVDYIFKAKGITTYSHLDIGAHHPYEINNTYLSYKNGGRGINVEPNPTLFKYFLDERGDDINLNVGVSSKSGVLNYYMFNQPALNTFSSIERENLLSKGFLIDNTMKIEVMTINDIINKYYNNISPDVIFIDVEGLDFEIIQSFNFKEYRPKIICIETISFELKGNGLKNNELIELILQNNYILYADTNINSIFVETDFWHS